MKEIRGLVVFNQSKAVEGPNLWVTKSPLFFRASFSFFFSGVFDDEEKMTPTPDHVSALAFSPSYRRCPIVPSFVRFLCRSFVLSFIRPFVPLFLRSFVPFAP